MTPETRNAVAPAAAFFGLWASASAAE